MLWKLELDEEYFRIYDSKKMIAGYFDPDYGETFPKKNSEAIIASMLKNRDKIPGGFLMVPLVKFALFDSDLNTSLPEVRQNVTRVDAHLKKWQEFLQTMDLPRHSIGISHTDKDMLTITFEVKFQKPTPLEKNFLAEGLNPTLDLLQESGLL